MSHRNLRRLHQSREWRFKVIHRLEVILHWKKFNLLFKPQWSIQVSESTTVTEISRLWQKKYRRQRWSHSINCLKMKIFHLSQLFMNQTVHGMTTSASEIDSSTFSGFWSKEDIWFLVNPFSINLINKLILKELIYLLNYLI